MLNSIWHFKGRLKMFSNALGFKDSENLKLPYRMGLGI